MDYKMLPVVSWNPIVYIMFQIHSVISIQLSYYQITLDSNVVMLNEESNFGYNTTDEKTMVEENYFVDTLVA